MEIDAKEWINDLEKQGNATATKLAVLENKVDTVMHNSDVRLAAIMERFDRLEQAEIRKEAKIQAAKRLWIPLGFSAVMAMGGLIKLAYIDPMNERLDAIDRRLKYVEHSHASAINHSEPK